MLVDLMVEGQEGVGWDAWVALARACEEQGLDGLFRSDHYGSLLTDEVRGSLDAWATLAALGPITERIRLGTMVSPASFRHPSVLAKCVVTADHTSGGRVTLGMGAGWNEEEHRAYGFPFHDVGSRLSILEEQVEIVSRQFTEDEPFDFDGTHHRLLGCNAEPKPVQRPRPPLILGGSAGPRSAALAARWADEYNTAFPTEEDIRDRKGNVDRACADAGREPLAFSVMTGCVIGRDEGEVRSRAAAVAARSGDDVPVDDWIAAHRDLWLVGTVEALAARLRAWSDDLGVSRVLLQHLDHEDLGAVALMGELADAVA